MQIVKDLTAELTKAEGKDVHYLVGGTILRLLAPQDLARPIVYEKDGWGQVTRVESRTDGTPINQRAPLKTKKVRKGESEAKETKCWTFKVEDDHVLVPWDGQFGIFKRALYRSLEAQRKLRYDAAPLALMKVQPEWLDLGEAPCDSMKSGKMPLRILETRHTARGDVMVDTFFDYVENRDFNCFVEIDSEAPINSEKFVALIKTLNTLDTIGPSKRGRINIDTIKQVED